MLGLDYLLQRVVWSCLQVRSGDLPNILFLVSTAWAAFINTITASGVPDLLLIAIVMAFFFLGFVLGLFEFARLTGLIMLGTSGGLAFGIRAMLLKEGLLISAVSLFALNWVLIAFFGILGGVSILWPAVQRGGIVGFTDFGCACVLNAMIWNSFLDLPLSGRSSCL